MNHIKASVSSIKKVESLTLVSFSLGQVSLEMVSLELPSSLKINAFVTLEVKSSNIILVKEKSNLLITANQLLCQVSEINNGTLLSTITLKRDTLLLEALITLEHSKKLALKKEEWVIALINPTELSIIHIDKA